MTAWRDFLDESNTQLRRNDLHRGLTWEAPDKTVTTRDAVAEYLRGFGYKGCGAREVIAAVGRDERGVKRALTSLVDDGLLRVTETLTRGPKASKRKVYWPRESTGATTLGLPDVEAATENEYGTGGGRSVEPRTTD